ncbi:class I SAM-dependent methyltransferase [Longispora sp. K20-0274]|uniref:class I SAM-dependent methyltransferase n=1 Tax=Longispora sp. K20-0274 TaxID=3088255 RepID=UPI0039997634
MVAGAAGAGASDGGTGAGPTDADRRGSAEAGSFDAAADNYRLGRPDYPDRVYELLRAHGLGPDSRILEVGAGTGQATRVLLAHGATVTAVEPGHSLTALLRADLAGPRLRVIEDAFEHADVTDGAFDLAVCATAFHWLDRAVAVPKFARALRPGGTLAVWWTVYGDPGRPTAFRAALDALYEQHLPGARVPTEGTPRALRIDERVAELTATGEFGDVAVEVIRWEHRLTAVGARRLFGTFPNIRGMAEGARAEFLDAIAGLVDGEVSDPYSTVVYLARRV